MKKFFAILILGAFFLTGCSSVEYDNAQLQLIQTLENDGWTCKRSSCVYVYEDYSYKYNIVENTYECNFNSFEVIHGSEERTKFKVNIDFIELTGEGNISVSVDLFVSHIEATYDFSSNSITCTLGEDILCNSFKTIMESCYNQMTDYFADSGYIAMD